MLQRDLDKALEWLKENLFPSNTDYCETMHVRHKPTYVYKIEDDMLKTSSQEQDLGVVMQDGLGCLAHSLKTSKTVNQHVGLLRRAFGRFSPSTFPQMLNTYVRPHVEYANHAWKGWLKRNMAALETDQLSAAKVVKVLSHLQYHR